MALLLIAVVAASMSVAPSSTVLAQSSGICERTQEVRDAILAKLSDVSECANVTDSHLAGITGDLTLSNESISALKAGDFKGLSGLEQLYLDTNDLSNLPDGIFEGLERLDTLWLNFNTGSPFSLTMTLEQEGSNSVVVKVAEGAPFDMEITLSAEGGTLSSTTVTVEGGSIKSDAVSVSPSDQNRVQTADVQVTVSVESSDFSATDYSSYFGLTWEEADDLELTLAAPLGICGRTQEVQDAILALLSGVSDCADVTDAHLAGIAKLVVNFTSATSIKSGDFAGLSSMTWLQPTGSSYIRSVPEDVFDGLSNLQRLYLSLDLTALPEDVFDGLVSLQILVLGANQIRALPEDVFDGLTSLTDLRLHNNQLAALPEDVFDGLASLENLALSVNNISELHKDLFDSLDNLDGLILTKNKLPHLVLVAHPVLAGGGVHVRRGCGDGVGHQRLECTLALLRAAAQHLIAGDGSGVLGWGGPTEGDGAVRQPDREIGGRLIGRGLGRGVPGQGQRDGQDHKKSDEAWGYMSRGDAWLPLPPRTAGTCQGGIDIEGPGV